MRTPLRACAALCVAAAAAASAQPTDDDPRSPECQLCQGVVLRALRVYHGARAHADALDLDDAIEEVFVSACANTAHDDCQGTLERFEARFTTLFRTGAHLASDGGRPSVFLANHFICSAADSGEAPPCAPRFELASPAFTSPVAEGASDRLPPAYTCDGEDGDGGERDDDDDDDKAGVSPPLEWAGAPVGTRSFVLMLRAEADFIGDHRDAIAFRYLWLGWDLAAATNSAAAGAALSVEGTNDRGARGYAPPCPPHGGGKQARGWRWWPFVSNPSSMCPSGSPRDKQPRVLANARAQCDSFPYLSPSLPKVYRFELLALDVPRLAGVERGATAQEVWHASRGHVLAAASLDAWYERGADAAAADTVTAGGVQVRAKKGKITSVAGQPTTEGTELPESAVGGPTTEQAGGGGDAPGEEDRRPKRKKKKRSKKATMEL